MANPFVHVELQTNDAVSARKFYTSLFGWKLQDVPIPGGTYTMIDVGGGPGGGLIRNPVPGGPRNWPPSAAAAAFAPPPGKPRGRGARGALAGTGAAGSGWWA